MFRFYWHEHIYRRQVYRGHSFVSLKKADPGGRAVYGLGVRLFACWDWGFESRRGYRCLSLKNVVSCQVEFPASGFSPTRGSPTDCGVSECVLEGSTMRLPWAPRVVAP